jgi:hypothetical protein
VQDAVDDGRQQFRAYRCGGLFHVYVAHEVARVEHGPRRCRGASGSRRGAISATTGGVRGGQANRPRLPRFPPGTIAFEDATISSSPPANDPGVWRWTISTDRWEKVSAI